MRVEVAYATPEAQALVALEVGEGTTAAAAIRASGVLVRFPEIDIECMAVGIFGKPCGLEQRLRPGDRVEIYRPLRADPKDIRRRQAFKPPPGRR